MASATAKEPIRLLLLLAFAGCGSIRNHLRTVHASLLEHEVRGHDVECARRIWLEAKWLLRYRRDAQDAESRLRDVSRSLNGEEVPCAEAWFWRLDALADRVLSGESAEGAAEVLDRVNSPDKLRAYLHSILISDVPGEDHRKELNLAVSALTRLVLRGMPKNYTYDPELAPALLEFMDGVWQDEQTGYFGPWYRRDGSIQRESDLSITFHIASYRRGDVRHWPAIIETTLAIRDREYPNGWLEDGSITHHHAYDVVRLFRLGWPSANDELRDRIRTEILRMLAWSIDSGWHDDGTPTGLEREDSIGDAYYFGASFLEEVGAFDPARCFWGGPIPPKARSLREAMRARVIAFGDPPRDRMLRDALEKLEPPADP